MGTPLKSNISKTPTPNKSEGGTKRPNYQDDETMRELTIHYATSPDNNRFEESSDKNFKGEDTDLSIELLNDENDNKFDFDDEHFCSQRLDDESGTTSKQQISYLNYSDKQTPSDNKNNQQAENMAEAETLNISIKNEDYMDTDEKEFHNANEMLMNQYEDYVSKISPIKNSSPRDEDSKILEMFYRNKQQEVEEPPKQNNYETTDLNEQNIGSNDAGNSYNSLLYFKTTDEGQQKMFNSYDYMDDLIKNTKESKFKPIRQYPR